MDPSRYSRRQAEAEIIVRAWKDETFMEKLLSNPKEALRDLGRTVPEDLEVAIVQETERMVSLVLPARPDNIETLTDSELLRIAAKDTAPRSADQGGVPHVVII
jgi:hypothetical protein